MKKGSQKLIGRLDRPHQRLFQHYRSNPDPSFGARMSPSAGCGHAPALALSSNVPILLQKSAMGEANCALAPSCHSLR
jgi:hypothetical protein